MQDKHFQSLQTCSDTTFEDVDERADKVRQYVEYLVMTHGFDILARLAGEK